MFKNGINLYPLNSSFSSHAQFLVFFSHIVVTQFLDQCFLFSSNVADLVEVLDNQSKKIEMEKLRAIGQRNKVEQEADARRRRAQELNALIMDKQAELDRIQFHVDSLEKVEREQKALIEKLSNNDV
jgi:intraflagellar transport protein 20